VRRWHGRHSPAQGRMLDECLRRQGALDHESRREVIQHRELRYNLSVIEGHEAWSTPERPSRNGERWVNFFSSSSLRRTRGESGRVEAIRALEARRARRRLDEEIFMDWDLNAVWQAYENRERTFK